MNFNYKDVTLILTIHKIKYEEINYWETIYKKLKKKNVNFHILFDSELISEFAIPWADREDMFLTKKNYGKLSRVYKHIKEGNVNTEYIKVLDPDDWFSLKYFLKIKIPVSGYIIKFKKIHSNKNSFANTYFNNENKLIRNYWKYSKFVDPKIWYKNFEGNYEHRYSFDSLDTILPVKNLFLDKIFEKFYEDTNITFGEDQILGFICWHNGSKFFETKSKNFYIYNENAGWTNPDFIKGNKTVISQLEQGFEIWRKYFEIKKNFPYTNWPFYEIKKYKINGSKLPTAILIEEDLKNHFKNKIG